ncbi:MAG TPA: crosslink repair DNA glycosylase YcaQ family protein, partial [Acidimicrobiales bacterium]|nr:crosslink repair DNA glycosylase YcaQ family protein [Acidimicrobiales bacterium]
MRRLTVAERRARIGVRHHLGGSWRADDVVDLAEDLVGLHATDPATVFLSAASRLRRPDDGVRALERALYEERTLVRTLGMRRTMFVIPSELVPVVQAACTDPLVPRERRRVVTMIEAAGVAADGARWLRMVEKKTLAALEELGEATASTLVKAVPELATQFSVGEGKTWAGKVGLSTRVLFLLATEQQVAR